MSKINWTTSDSNKARRLGWDVFYNTDVDENEIQRVDETSVFESDAHAIEHVLRNAKRNKTCRKAIKFVYGF
jgi:hypothetical protein